MSLITRVEKNLSKFVPSILKGKKHGLRKRYGHSAPASTGLRKHMHVLVTGSDGAERAAVVKSHLGKTIRVRFEHDGSTEDVHAASVRRAV
ncbi:MAG: hypothetical protein ACLP1X_15110 [Polyangiaceae bacterium]|jgi:hypothetical protein